MSYSVIVSHVLMRPNEAFAAKIGIKRSGGILIEMNQQAREHFFFNSLFQGKMNGFVFGSARLITVLYMVKKWLDETEMHSSQPGV